MSSWDETVFSDETNTDFLDDCVDLEELDLMEMLEDACSSALNLARPGETDYVNGLCAASVAAIWCGAPFSASDVVSDYPFIRRYIGDCPESLQEAALQVLDRELDDSGADAPEGLETYVEALS